MGCEGLSLSVNPIQENQMGNKNVGPGQRDLKRPRIR